MPPTVAASAPGPVLPLLACHPARTGAPGEQLPDGGGPPGRRLVHHLPGDRLAFLPVSPAATLTMTIASSPGLSTRGTVSVYADITGMNH